MSAILAEIAATTTLTVRIPNADGWRITIDDRDGRGFVSLTDGYLSASYFWPLVNRGTTENRRSLVRFLLTRNESYLAGKFGWSDYFDASATVSAARATIKDLYPDHDGRGVAESALDDVDSMGAFESWVHASAPGDDACYVFNACMKTEPSFLRLWTEGFPALLAEVDRIEAAVYPNGLPYLASEKVP